MTAITISHTGYACLEDMYRTESYFVLGIVKRRVRNRAVAQDLTQDTFMRVLCNVDKYTPQENKPARASFRDWIGTIAKNVVHSYFYRRNLEQKHTDKGEDICGEYNRSNAEDLVQRKEGLENTLQVIQSIADPGKRETARLWFVEDRKYAEISAELGIPLGTVMSRLNRSKKEMKSLYEKGVRNHINE